MDYLAFIYHHCEEGLTSEGATGLIDFFEMIVWYMNILAFCPATP
jgi:hypothetical protein